MTVQWHHLQAACPQAPRTYLGGGVLLSAGEHFAVGAGCECIESRLFALADVGLLASGSFQGHGRNKSPWAPRIATRSGARHSSGVSRHRSCLQVFVHRPDQTLSNEPHGWGCAASSTYRERYGRLTDTDDRLGLSTHALPGAMAWDL